MADCAFRVLSFNIRGQVKKDGVNAWPLRGEVNLSIFGKANADLIGFQEMQDENWAFYEERLRGYERRLGTHYNNTEPFNYLSIFWRPEKLQALAEGRFWLSKTPEVHSGDWDTDCFRGAHWIRFRPKAGGKEFVFLNTHLDHVSEYARAEGSKVILEQLKSIAGKLPVLVTGDFNCDPGSAAYRTFLEGGFADTFQQAGNADGPDVYSFHKFTGERQPGIGRIDWILTRGGKPGFSAKSCRILFDAQPPLYPSDHFPVLAELTLA